MANLSQLKDRIYHNTGGLYTENFHMTDLINDALAMLIDGAKLKGLQTINVVPQTAEYTLPADFKSPGTLQDETCQNGAVVPYNLVDISENRYGYAIADGNIVLKPLPTQAATLTHYYYKYATVLVADIDIPEIDATYHYLLANYASAVILMMPGSQNSPAIADRFMVQWEKGMKSFYMDMARKNKLTRTREKVIW